MAAVASRRDTKVLRRGNQSKQGTPALFNSRAQLFIFGSPLYSVPVFALGFYSGGAVLLAVGLARGYFFFIFCNKGIILDHTARAARRAGDDFSAAALQQSNFL